MKSRLLVFAWTVLVIPLAGGASATGRETGSSPTFNKDVAPMIFKHCVTCHRPNQVAPMTLLSYREVRPWARAIKAKVVAGEMPPWYADGRYLPPSGTSRCRITTWGEVSSTATTIQRINSWTGGAYLAVVDKDRNMVSITSSLLVATMVAEKTGVLLNGRLHFFSLDQK